MLNTDIKHDFPSYQPAGEDHYVICIDDDVTFLKSMEILLSEKISDAPANGIFYRVICLSCPLEALEMIRELIQDGEIISMIICDHNMPHMSGTELLAQAKRLSPHSSRVLLTGYAGLESAVEAINNQILDKYLTKPISDEQDFIQSLWQMLKMHFVNLQLRRSEEKVRFLAYKDGLTRLPNREAFRDRLTQALALAHRYGRMMALLSLDLDNFKRINDTMGHSAGDRLLQFVAQRLHDCVRSSDCVTHGIPDEQVARLGGDEFTVMLSEIGDGTDAAIVAERIVQALSSPFDLGGHEVIITPSIGISVFPVDGQNVETLLKNADMAMYQAKRSGKNGFRFYDQSLGDEALKRMVMEGQLRKALARNEFILNYQPQIDVATGCITGTEALLRWKNDELGIVSPADFIPILEDTGLILAVGEWVLRTACAQAKAWQDAGLSIPRMGVNLSARQFSQPDLAAMAAAILEETGLSAHCLELEITESMVMGDGEESLNTLHALKAMGVQIAIDDFGTGYSNLGYLTRLPIDRLKIDQSFVRNIGSPSDSAIVSTVIAMAENLKLSVIAEGVETEMQRHFLETRQCREMQGYLFCRPITAEGIPDLVSRLSRLSA